MDYFHVHEPIQMLKSIEMKNQKMLTVLILKELKLGRSISLTIIQGWNKTSRLTTDRVSFDQTICARVMYVVQITFYANR